MKTGTFSISLLLNKWQLVYCIQRSNSGLTLITEKQVRKQVKKLCVGRSTNFIFSLSVYK